MQLIVIGGGAAGFFGAITAAEHGHCVTILEANNSVLTKVRISGGGRCNLTHSCFDPRDLVQAYPRGGKALRGPFSRFQPSDTLDWFASRGVSTKTEEDGRIFPTSNDSQTIVECLQDAAKQAGVGVHTQARVETISLSESDFHVTLRDQPAVTCDAILLATGGSRGGWKLAADLGHSIVPPVPSLFTFKVNDPRIADLPGVAVQSAVCELMVGDRKFSQQGPVLITHWGLSGPAILKLSAWAARELHDAQYHATLRINWLPSCKQDQVTQLLAAERQAGHKRRLDAWCPWELPKRLWKSLLVSAGCEGVRWTEVSNKSIQRLVAQLVDCRFEVAGKGQFKEEFVTCGGVDLKEVDFRTMQSRVCQGLYLAGEVLDVDGITGGFNFQNAWTTAWIAGSSV